VFFFQEGRPRAFAAMCLLLIRRRSFELAGRAV
jgi:hypothetical protein